MRILAPPFVPAEFTADVAVAGPPDDLRPSAAIVHWPGAGALSMSWTYDRPDHWTHLLVAIDQQLHPWPWDGEQWTDVEVVEPDIDGIEDPCYAETIQLPKLGLTVVTFHGLEHAVVLVRVGEQEPLETYDLRTV